ncbi:MAG: class I SAM-dependent methyltransferase [Mycobacteriales bacterium]
MDLAELRKHWDTFGRTDPLFAVLSDPYKRYGRWDRDEFFADGRTEIEDVLAFVRERAIAWGAALRFRRALDFGCGVGRLTQALARHFRRVDGVDIAPSMLSAARRYARLRPRCRFHLNTDGDLRQFRDGTFDFVYTNHVLQHMEPQFATAYIAEFLRVLRPGAFAMFELVTEEVRGAGVALPDDGFRAELSVSGLPERMPPGHRLVLRVDVTNAGTTTLPAAGVDGWYLVSVANHWSRGEARIVDDGRARLPRDLAPGERCDLELEVVTPSESGTWTLEVDCVQEGVAWFADKGSTTATAALCVDPGAERPDPLAPYESDARMEMHGIPEDEVRRVVTAAGGEVLESIDWERISGKRSYDWNRRGFLCRAGS